MAWLGKFSHENTITVPSFWDKAGKIMLLGFEDGEPTDSEIYMYVANSFEDLWNGNGQLYVFGGNDSTAHNSWNDIYYENWWVRAQWVPLDWDYASQDETDLNRVSRQRRVPVYTPRGRRSGQEVGLEADVHHLAATPDASIVAHTGYGKRAVFISLMGRLSFEPDIPKRIIRIKVSRLQAGE